MFTYKDTTVISSNSDTPYSVVGMDLRAEPLVLTVPAVEKQRYYSVQSVDWNTFNVGYIGSRATGNDGGVYLVVGPDEKDINGRLAGYVGYRALGVDYEDGSGDTRSVFDVIMHGPMIGPGFHF